MTSKERDMSRPTKMHSVERTNPKGVPFIGTCVLCGRQNMTMEEAMQTECENQRGLTAGEAVVDAVSR